MAVRTGNFVPFGNQYEGFFRFYSFGSPKAALLGVRNWPSATHALRRYALGTALEPLNYAFTLGTASTQILPANPTRRGLIFYNPGPNTVAVCPALSNTGANVPAVVNGAGSITIGVGTVITVPPVAWIDATSTAAWNAVASGPSTPFTAWEF